MNRLIEKILFGTLLILSTNIFSQPTQEWISVYPNSGNSSLVMCIDSSGNVYSSGYDEVAPYGFVTIKYSSSGQQLWARRFVGGMNFIARPVTMGCDPQGNIYVAAYDESMILVKYSPSGVQQWFRRYPANYLSDMVITKYGFPVITGTVINGAPTRNDCVTVKYNPSGDTLWSAVYNSPANNFDWSVAMDISLTSEICITGYSSNLGNTEIDFLTVKYDSNGIYQWVRTYGNVNSWDEAKDVGFDKNGNIYIAGGLGDFNISRYCIIKYNTIGSEEWARVYHNSENIAEYPSHLKIDGLSNVVITGSAFSIDSLPRRKFLTIKYNSLGNLQWNKQVVWQDGISPPPSNMQIDIQNNIYIIGISTIDFNTNKYGLYAIKYYLNGMVSWEISYNGPFNNASGKNIIVDKNLEVLMNGHQANGQNTNFITMKYSQPIGINPVTNEIPKDFKLFQNYPNPFNPSTIINYQVSQNNSLIELTMYDLTGRAVKELVSQKQNIGVYQVNFNAENLSSGIYFYKLTVNGKIIDTKKMILVK